MNPEARYKITSNDYADFVFEGYDLISAIAKAPEYSLQNIGNKYGIAYLPVGYMASNSVQIFGYAAIPKLYGLLSHISLESSGITRIRNEPNYNLRGQGVLIGFLDTGIDYTNTAFRKADLTTRIVSIWDQTIYSENNYPENFYYGTEYNQDQINSALTNADPFSIVPSMDTIGHGTTLAGVAAGTENCESNFCGVAPDTEIVVVKLKGAKPYLKEYFCVSEDVISFQSNDIMLGINYLLNVAGRLNRPIVICMGVGTNQGAHDGGCILCRYLQDIGNASGNSVVIAAGNEGNLRHHFYGEINPSKEQDTIGLNVAENEKGFSLELWGYVPNIVEVDIYSPDFQFVTHIPETLGPEETKVVEFKDTTIWIDNQISETASGNQLILMRFQNPQSGIWRFTVSVTGDLNTRYHMWLPMYHFISEGTYFFNSNSNTTISDSANTTNTITVTAYNPINESLYYNASRGFTKNNGLKPDIAAPGVDIKAPSLGNTFIRTTGTGIAAAHTSGVAAMLLEWGLVKGNLPAMNNVMIRRMLVSGARRFNNITYPNQDWGFGILDIYRTFMLFLEEGI
ncbi:MAG: S8 family peptidase [Anaerocolumna sp.]